MGIILVEGANLWLVYSPFELKLTEGRSSKLENSTLAEIYFVDIEDLQLEYILWVGVKEPSAIFISHSLMILHHDIDEQST